MLQIVEADAIEGARDQRQLDLDVLDCMRPRRARPFAERVAIDRYDLIAFDKAPGGLARGSEFHPAHGDFPCYSAAARGGIFQAPAMGRLSPRFSRKVLPA